MMLAPVLSGVTCQSVTISDGLPGIYQTLDRMRGLVRQFRVDPAIRQAAIGATFLTPEKDHLCEIDACFSLVRDGVRYVRDINDVETIATPMITMASKIGDCDDQSVLLASLFESIGYPTRFVIAGYSEPGVFEHVYLQVYAANCWIDCDPTEQHPLGWSAPDPVCLSVENI